MYNHAGMAKLTWVIPASVAVATTANVVFYFLVTSILGWELLFPNEASPPGLSAMPVNDVIIFSVIFSLGAGAVYAAVLAIASRPIGLYIVISAVVLLLSFAMPMSISSPPVEILDKLVLVAMHIIGAVSVVGVLVSLGAPMRSDTTR